MVSPDSFRIIEPNNEPKIIDLKEKQNNFAIPRICIPDGTNKYENLARMSTVWSKIFKD